MKYLLEFLVENNFHFNRTRKKWYSTRMKYNNIVEGQLVTYYYTEDELINLFTQSI